MKVVVIGDGDWVEVTEIPGIAMPGCRLEHAFVRVEELTYPH